MECSGEDAWKSQAHVAGSFNIFLLPVLWKRLGVVLSSLHPELRGYDGLSRPVDSQRWIADMVLPCSHLILCILG